MKKNQRKIIFGLAALLSGPGLSTAALAQDQAWDASYNKACTAVQTSLVENMRQITADGLGRVSIAHRGAYSQPLPGTTLYPAENTILAFQYAQCQGFAGVEVDLKMTADSVLILGHDTNFMRFTNYDFNGGNFNPEVGAEIRTFDHGITRPPSGNKSALIANMSWPDIAANTQFVKTYDEKGQKRANAAVTSPSSMKLEDVLVRAKTDPTINKVVWILDIQTHQQFDEVYDIVQRNNLWDRVIFKMWMNAVPLIGDVAGNYYVAIPPQSRGHYVFSVSPINSRMNGGVLETKYYDDDAHFEAWMNNASLMSGAIKAFANGSLSNPYAFDGVELFVTGSGGELNTAITFVQQIVNTYNAPGREWGVIRIADYVRENCSTPGPAGDCTSFPNGDYFGNAQVDPADATKSYVRLYSLPASDLVNRRQYAETREVETEDVRWPGGRLREINSPNQRTTFISSIGTIFEYNGNN